ncbi:hypothetical protein GSI_09564 [Ganoderma sinense ZZ0214-1]|uniref:Integrase catalytic domain-containing protein n=1 Tax=Ganoderma sinense ZZ0214-1 TaxID=1077348 RepID=A0A2G8S3C6_9APHY|nr:hypothetical protein GSI_09564 [Ganoderma sinense ZZ0214-1]
MTTATDAAAQATRVRIDPLTGVEDWGSWSVQMEDLLYGLGLWGYVKEVNKPKPKDTEKPTKEETEKLDEWRKLDRSALSAIRMRVSKSLVHTLKWCTTSAEAWSRLEKNFEPKGILHVVQIRRKLLQAQYCESDDVEEFLRVMVGLRESLACMGFDLSEEEFSITLLTALPESWDPMVSSINHTRDLSDSDEIVSRIRQHASRINDSATALFARSSGKKKGPKCFKCHGKTGYQRDCPNHDSRKGKGKGKDSGHGKGKNEARGGGKKEKKEDPKALVAEESDSDSEYAFALLEEWDDSDSDEVALAARVAADAWVSDSATTVHVARRRADFSTYEPTPGRTLKGAGITPILGVGDINLEFEHEGRKTVIQLRDVVHAPAIPHNLIALGRVEAGGHKITMESGMIQFLNPKGQVYASGERVGNLYVMRAAVVPGKPADVACAAAVTRPKRVRTYDEWHRVLGHIGMKAVISMKKKGLVEGMEVDESVEPSQQCESCVRAKQTVAPYPKKSEMVVEAIGDLTVMDLWGKAPTTGIRGEKYFSTFTDMHSRRTVIEFSKTKTDELENFKAYQAHVQNVHGVKLKKIRCDNGGEYLSKDFTNYLRAEGIELDTTTPNSSAQNGVAKRVNRTVMDRALAILIEMDLPKFLWPEAVAHVAYLKNRSPTRALKDKTPEEVWSGRKPDVSDLQEWGVKCWVLTDRKKRTKLELKSQLMRFMGVAPGSKGWKYYDPKARRIGKSRNIIFAVPKRTQPAPDSDEDEYDLIELSTPTPLEGENVTGGEQASGGDRAPLTAQSTDAPAPAPPSKPTPVAPEPRTLRNIPRIDYKASEDGRGKVIKALTRAPVTTPSRDEEDEVEQLIDDPESHFLCLLTLHGTPTAREPRTFKEAMTLPEADQWRAAMDAEIAQLQKLGTWSMVDLPTDRKAIGCTWVYRIKENLEGEVKFKARLVAQGFSQIPGYDVFDTFAPVIRTDSVRTLLAIGTERNMEMRQFDVVGAYLNADLDEEIYMRQPPGYEDGTRKVLRLQKALYGLKQGGRKWNIHFNRIMVDELGFRRLNSDPCVYLRQDKHGLTIVGVHVDNMIALADTTALMDAFAAGLAKRVKITDLGMPSLLLGLEISRDRPSRTLSICQSQYILRVLERFGMADANPVSTPLDPNIKLVKTPDDADLSEMRDVPYQAAIGSLMYAALGTRPDISYAVQALSQYSSRPGPEHWTAVKRVLRYLKGTHNYGITFTGKGAPRLRAYYLNLRLEGYSDADWGSNPDDRRSISGYAFLVGNAVVAWSSKKQTTSGPP